MSEISICSTSWRFSSCNKTQYCQQCPLVAVPSTTVGSPASHLEGLRLKTQSRNALFKVGHN
jgi:hypothetical protein